jgi:hypothetical protein
VLIAVLTSATLCQGAGEEVPLSEAVRALNEEARKWPESRIPTPLTEDQVIAAIAGLGHDARLSDAEHRRLKQVAETRRLPESISLWQFVRYDDGTDVQHGWWVRLMLKGDQQGTFSLAIREEPALRRPYTQKERLFRDEVRQTGSVPTLNRLVAYFDEDPKFGTVQESSAPEADRLVEVVKEAIGGEDVDRLLTAYHWDRVDDATRSAVRSEAERLVKRQLSSVSVKPRHFGGRLRHWQGFQTWDPNLPVLGYVVVEFTHPDGRRSMSLEFGEAQGRAWLVNYIVSQDDRPRLIGKPMPRGVGVQGFPLVDIGDGWSECFVKIEAPDELPALQNASLELWRVRAR